MTAPPARLTPSPPRPAPPAGIPSWDTRLKGLQADFSAAFLAASPDFQTKYGYGVSRPGNANLTLCSKQVGERFGCLAVTLELPFKDNANLPDPRRGWSAERSQRLGAAALEAVLAVAPRLRGWDPEEESR